MHQPSTTGLGKRIVAHALEVLWRPPIAVAFTREARLSRVVTAAAALALSCAPSAGAQRSELPVQAAGSPASTAPAASPGPPPSEPVSTEPLRSEFQGKAALQVLSGKAAYYHDSLAGRKTASGAPYDPGRYTAAHRKLPFGTVLRVIRADDGRMVYVEVNDRGPFGDNARIVDLSRAAAEAIGMIRDGVVPVRVEVLRRGRP